jgi:hypothetical protein
MPTASPEVTIHPQLVVAENLLAAGNLDGARQAVDSLTGEEVEALSGAEIEVYNRLMQALQTMDVSRAIADLEKGLESSSVKMLRRAVPVLSNLDAAQQAETPGLAQKLERAREAARRRAGQTRVRPARPPRCSSAPVAMHCCRRARRSSSTGRAKAIEERPAGLAGNPARPFAS